MKTNKYIHNHPEWSALAEEHDNLKFRLLYRSDPRLRPAECIRQDQDRLKELNKLTDVLEKKLHEEGWLRMYG